MKLGTETNSLTNHLYARATKGQPLPVVGMGATILMWTDREPATIIDVWHKNARKADFGPDGAPREITDGLRIKVQRDDWAVVSGSGHDGSAVYAYTPNPNGGTSIFEWRGRWIEVRLNAETKRWIKADSGNGLSIGNRDKYWDPSF
jgi:hypothetical protein